jgi:hypothetical protein
MMGFAVILESLPLGVPHLTRSFVATNRYWFPLFS